MSTSRPKCRSTTCAIVSRLVAPVRTIVSSISLITPNFALGAVLMQRFAAQAARYFRRAAAKGNAIAQNRLARLTGVRQEGLPELAASVRSLAQDQEATPFMVLFAGFQAAGTRGAAMVAGADRVKIHGEYVRVNSANGRQKVKNMQARPLVTVTAVESGTSVSRETVTGANGRYSFVSLRPTTYEIRAELAGLALEEEIESRLVIEHGERPWELRRGPFAEDEFSKLPEREWTLLVQAVDQFVERGPFAQLAADGEQAQRSKHHKAFLEPDAADVVLADERAMSLESSPFATVATFAAYIEGLLDEPGTA